MYTKGDIVRILMRRDGISKSEAISCINNCQADIDYAVERGNYEEAEDALYYWLGLELDYLMCFL